MSTYSGYDDEPRRYRNVRVRPRERDEPDYVREETYIERGKGPGPRGAELVYRGRDDSIEDIPRDFPPPGRGNRRYDDYEPPRRSKSTGGRRGGYDDDDRYTDYGSRAGGGSRYDRQRGGRRDDRDYDSEYSRSPSPRRERKGSSGGLGGVLESLGVGGIVGGLLGNKDKGRDRSRSGSRGGRSARSRSRGARSRRDYSSSRSRSRGGNKNERKWAQAAQAALVAGAVEAFRSRKEPGPWTGEKGKRIATAALGAGGIDGLMSDRNPDDKSKRHLATAVLGGVAASRLANGSRANSRDRDDRSEYSPDRRPRSRSRSVIDRLRGRSKSRGRPASPDEGGGNGAVKGLLGAGAIAAAGKALYNKARSKSRKRRSPSNSSTDSYVPSRTRRRERRRSPRSDIGDTRRTDAASVRGGQDGQDDRALARGTNRNRNTAMVAGAGAGALANRSGGGGGKNNENDEKNKDGNDSSDSVSTIDMEKERRHTRGKEIVTASLATVATIHAAHGVYSSMHAHEARHKLVADGQMSPEQARKKQTKAWIQDAAAVGIAALGIKGAFSEWKQMNEQRRMVQDLEKRKTDRRKKREKREDRERKDYQERMMRAMENHPQLAIAHHMNQGYNPPPPQVDLSGNPYAPQGGGGGSQRY